MKKKEKIIITDTNILTDLYHAKILEQFVNLKYVYIVDLVLHDEINFKTGNVKLINKIKVINVSSRQIEETLNISLNERKLSIYDIINFIVARDNNGVLATGDKKLREFSLKNGVIVYRTLRIIKLMIEEKVISKDDAIKACELLKEYNNTRIPLEDINKLIHEFEDN